MKLDKPIQFVEMFFLIRNLQKVHTCQLLKHVLHKTFENQIIFVPDGESEFSLFTRTVDNLYNFATKKDYGSQDDWRNNNRVSSWMDKGAWKAYFAYLRSKNQVYIGGNLFQWFRSTITNVQCKRDWFDANPPLLPTDPYALARGANGTYYVVNKNNPRDSLKLSEGSGKLIKANIPSNMARQLLGQTAGQPVATPGAPDAPGAPVPGAPRRGRPAGVQNVRAPQPAAQAAAGGDINVNDRMTETGLLAAFNSLPRADRNRLNVTNARRVTPQGDRGAARRNNQLGVAGSVGQVLEIGPSKIYIIRLANQQIIASINIQPGNRNYILLPGGTMVTLNSPSELMQTLRQRNLAEVRNFIVREYITNNPQHIDEVREILRNHIDENRNK
jgi:hypothetical protein